MAIEHGASDIFLRSDRVPQLRIRGELMFGAETPLAGGELDAFWKQCGAPDGALDFDGSYVDTRGQRFRVNLFRSLLHRGAVLRPIKTSISNLEDLGLPAELLISWVDRPSGLVLVTGPTGSGKSTTLASCLNWLNHHVSRHIVTIEDPIEYLFEPVHCLFTQREVGIDTPTFEEGLRRSLRQSPDVILLGEIRDAVSAITALQAAETGHLVLATLHSSNVLDSLERLARLFEPRERASVMQVLSQQLVEFCASGSWSASRPAAPWRSSISKTRPSRANGSWRKNSGSWPISSPRATTPRIRRSCARWPGWCARGG